MIWSSNSKFWSKLSCTVSNSNLKGFVSNSNTLLLDRLFLSDWLYLLHNHTYFWKYKSFTINMFIDTWSKFTNETFNFVTCAKFCESTYYLASHSVTQYENAIVHLWMIDWMKRRWNCKNGSCVTETKLLSCVLFCL